MNAFDDAWTAAVLDVGRRLTQLGIDAPVRSGVAGLLRRASCPGRLALLAGASDGSGVTGEAFLGLVAGRAATEGAIDEAEVTAALHRVLRGEPGAASSDDVERIALEMAARALVTQGIPVDPSNVATAARLLRTGAFYDDLARTSAVVLATVTSLPESVVTDLVALPTRPTRLLEAVLADAAGLLRGGAVALVTNLLHEGGSEGPRVLGNTLTAVYDMAVPRQLATAVRALLADENESFRLALLIYARANGIALEPRHLDLLRDHVFDVDEPNLAPILRAVVEERLASSDHAAVLEMLHGLSKRAA